MSSRSRVDDHATLAVLTGLVRGHYDRRETDHVERADEVDVDDVPEGVERVRLPVLADDERGRTDPGAVDDAAQAAELADGCVDGFLDARFVADVGLDECAQLLAAGEIGD